MGDLKMVRKDTPVEDLKAVVGVVVKAMGVGSQAAKEVAVGIPAVGLREAEVQDLEEPAAMKAIRVVARMDRGAPDTKS